MLRKLTTLLLALSFICIGSTIAYSAEIKIGQNDDESSPRIILEPMVDVSYRFDSNYWKAETDKQDVHTYTVNLGLNFGLSTSKGDLVFQYNISPTWYDGKDSPPGGAVTYDDIDFTAHSLSTGGQFQATDRIVIGFDDGYSVSRDSAASDALSNATDRDKYWQNALGLYSKYAFNDKFGIGLRYEHNKIEYKLTARENQERHTGIFSFDYNFNSTTSASVEYHFTDAQYDKTTSDYKENKGMLVLNKDFGAVTSSLGAGYQNREFEQSGVSDLGSFNSFLTLSTPLDSDMKTHTSLTVSYGLNDLGFSEDYYKALRVSGTVGYLFFTKLDVYLTGMYQNTAYENRGVGGNAGRDDDTWQLSLGTGYQLTRLFDVSVEGGLESRTSNFSGKGYDNEFVLVTLGVKM